MERTMDDVIEMLRIWDKLGVSNRKLFLKNADRDTVIFLSLFDKLRQRFSLEMICLMLKNLEENEG